MPEWDFAGNTLSVLHGGPASDVAPTVSANATTSTASPLPLASAGSAPSARSATTQPIAASGATAQSSARTGAIVAGGGNTTTVENAGTGAVGVGGDPATGSASVRLLPSSGSAAPSLSTTTAPPPAPRAGASPATFRHRWTLPKYLASVKEHVLKTGLFLRTLSFLVTPPNALAAGRVLFPEDWCVPRVLVYAPFDMLGPYRPFCPTCGTAAVNQNGWSTFRRVIDLDECILVVCRRYRCTKKHKGKCFLSWDAKLLEKAPPYIKHAFPILFTHRLGVTQAVFDAMRSWTASGGGFGPFADFVREQHTRMHHRKELAYLSRLSDVMAESPFGEPRVSGCTSETAARFPRFPHFSDSYGANGCHGSKNFFRSVYTRGMRRLEAKIKKRCAMIPARMLSGDHFFKIVKCNFLFKGKKLFMAAYSLVKEHTEVMATVLTQSKSLEELRQMLVSVQQRMIALGLPAPHIDVFFTDNPTAEASFLEGVYPGLRKTSVPLKESSTAPHPPLTVPADHFVDYIVNTDDANTAIDNIRKQVKNKRGGGVVGFDAEWNVDGGPNGRGPGQVRVVQVSTLTDTLVLHISRMSTFPHQLKALMADPDIIKTGKSIGGDCKKLRSEHGAATVSTVEVANFAKSRQLVGNATIGLAGLVAVLLQRTLDKSPGVCLSDWSRPLSSQQQTYAALDSYASFLVYLRVLQSSSPVPERSSNLQGMELYVADASGTFRVAVCTVADAQPPKHGNFVVGAKGRVWVKVTRVLVSAFTLPFTVKRQPKTLAILMQHNAQIGKDPVFVVSRSHLRDADHPVEKRLAEQRAPAARPVLPVES